jgi:hypothetical protein
MWVMSFLSILAIEAAVGFGVLAEAYIGMKLYRFLRVVIQNYETKKQRKHVA